MHPRRPRPIQVIASKGTPAPRGYRFLKYLATGQRT